jgi:hypothetical protein
LRKNINLIKGVQRRFTNKILIKKTGLGYEERLKCLGLPSLEFRQLKGGLIEVFKIMHGHYDPLTTNSLLNIRENKLTRGHKFTLIKHFNKLGQYHKFFTNRIISCWNNLPPEAVNAESLNAFKNKIDIIYKDIMYSTDLECCDPKIIGRH